MTKAEIFKALCELQKLAWKDDDMMDQDTLFTMQEQIADLTLELAKDTKKESDLLKSFPYIYMEKYKEVK